MKGIRCAVLLVVVLAVCRCGPPPRVPTRQPYTDLPPVFEQGATRATGTSLANQPWFDVFQDAELQALIRAALAGNTDVQIAAVRILEAQAVVGLARADQRPQITAVGSGGGQKTPTLGSTQGRTAAAMELEGTLSWDLDFWGRLAQATTAARAQLVAAEWSRRAVVTTLVGDVASEYLHLRALDLELEIARRTLVSRQASLNLARVREQGGAASLVDVRQAEQLVYGASSTIIDFERQISVTEHAIAILLGRATFDVPRGLALTDEPHMPDVPSGLPSDLLQQRPDVQQAEQVVVAASAQLESARAAFFPRISLTGAGGIASTALTALFTGGATLWSAIATAAQPVFDGNRRLSQLELADARRQEAVLAYEGAVRSAFREVADALVSYQRNREFREQQELLQQSAQDARRLAQVRYEGGVTSYLEVLDADTRLFAAELGSADARLRELTTYVDLYRVLGGGWR